MICLKPSPNGLVSLQKMNPDNLNKLMKLGSGVSKVLDIKDKLLSNNK